MRRRKDEFEESVVGDVRRARAVLLAKFGNDLRRLGRHLMAEQAKHPELVVNLRQQNLARSKSRGGRSVSVGR
jgi:hypothetical protein